MQEPSYIGKNAIVFNMVENGNNAGIQKCSHLEVSTKCQYSTCIMILIPIGRFLIPLLMLIIIDIGLSLYIYMCSYHR